MSSACSQPHLPLRRRQRPVESPSIRLSIRIASAVDCAASAAQVLDRGGCTLLRFPSATSIRVRSAQLLTPRPLDASAHTLRRTIYSAHFCFGLIADWVAKSCRVWASFLVSHSCLRDIVVHGITNRQVLAHVRVHLPGPEAREHSDARVRAHHAHRLRPF